MGSRAWLGGGRLGAHPGSVLEQSCGALSAMLGRASDHRDDRVYLWERDYPVILAALQHDPAEPELDELVVALEKRLAREPDGL
jgi:hypothetical protein